MITFLSALSSVPVDPKLNILSHADFPTVLNFARVSKKEAETVDFFFQYNKSAAEKGSAIFLDRCLKNFLNQRNQYDEYGENETLLTMALFGIVSKMLGGTGWPSVIRVQTMMNRLEKGIATGRYRFSPSEEYYGARNVSQHGGPIVVRSVDELEYLYNTYPFATASRPLLIALGGVLRAPSSTVDRAKLKMREFDKLCDILGRRQANILYLDVSHNGIGNDKGKALLEKISAASSGENLQYLFMNGNGLSSTVLDTNPYYGSRLKAMPQLKHVGCDMFGLSTQGFVSLGSLKDLEFLSVRDGNWTCNRAILNVLTHTPLRYLDMRNTAINCRNHDEYTWLMRQRPDPKQQLEWIGLQNATVTTARGSFSLERRSPFFSRKLSDS